MVISIDNLRSTREGIRCDRKFPLGNPFALLSGSGDRERDIVVDAYGYYLHLVANLQMSPTLALQTANNLTPQPLIIHRSARPFRHQFMAELNRLEELARSQDITLLCWCYPLRCHCDRIADYLRWRLA
jgi:hypothetical protein